MTPADDRVDLGGEPLLLLSQAARLVPGRGKRGGVDPSTLWRWSTVGRKGRKLRVIATPGGLCTRQSWLEAFLTDCTAERRQKWESRLRTNRARRSEQRRAAEILDRAGIR